MKKIFIILGLVFLSALVSCNTADKTLESSGTGDTNLETNTDTSMADLSGSVVVDTNHALAGKTLNFEVEMVKITKGSGSTSEAVESGDKVEVHYNGTLTEDGSKFDSSYDRGETLPFTVGAKQMIAGFDAGVIGMKEGEKKTLTLAPEEAYGEYDEARKEVIPKADLKSFVNAGYKLEVGEKLPTQFGEFEIVEVLPEGAEPAVNTEAETPENNTPAEDTTGTETE